MCTLGRASTPEFGLPSASLRDMEQRQLGASGLRVSRLGLGTMTWGRDTGEDEAAAQLAAFAEAAGTLVDTADIYAGGDSELIVGRLLRGVVPRADMAVATK